MDPALVVALSGRRTGALWLPRDAVARWARDGVRAEREPEFVAVAIEDGRASLGGRVLSDGANVEGRGTCPGSLAPAVGG